ncbi:DUF4442 domain-containing protein [Chitinimonas arctica]|uniref:DUF4442 domain-containing protein n=1 Tax=Chitinimonas arctica TaxID=2594795 RepID=A0A516SCF0_9NEIS|nr:DUF4442 domain-containing protein [Chitinimonas arctica]QDQ25820.1 DUF4442 domain-containing protein [Chitinimonas arctica]
MKASTFKRLINLWPPFLLTGIHANHVSADYREVDCTLTMHWYNRNAVGTHFGGSLFAMTDAWYMLMLMEVLGKDYYVWDQAAAIEFIAPSRGVITARFRLDDNIIADIRAKTEGGEKYLPKFTVELLNEKGERVAQVIKTLYIRRKPAKR